MFVRVCVREREAMFTRSVPSFTCPTCLRVWSLGVMVYTKPSNPNTKPEPLGFEGLVQVKLWGTCGPYTACRGGYDPST